MTARRKGIIAAVLVGLALPVLAQAPQALTILVNNFPLQGKALWYKGKIYVPLEDVARSTGGQFSYDPASATAVATVGTATAAAPTNLPAAVVTATAAPTAAVPSASERSGARPYLKVVYERKYTTGNNARVVATVLNQGEKSARNIEVICTFKDGLQRELTSSVQNAGTLAPGESRTLEFQLGTGFYPPLSPGFGQEDHIYIDGHWTRVSYALRFNYH